MVTIKWKITYSNGTDLTMGDQFQRVSGSVRFADGQSESTLSLVILSDGVPEYDITYKVQIYNVTG